MSFSPMDFPYDLTYKDLVIEAQTNGNITAEFTSNAKL